MTFAERGIYLELMVEAWIRGSLPDDPNALADAIANSEAQAHEIRASWPMLRRKFVAAEGQPGRIVNPALERVRSARLKWLEHQRYAGKQSAAKRAAELEPRLNRGSTSVQPASTTR